VRAISDDKNRRRRWRKKPLGYITLNSENAHNTKVPIHPMNDIFSNYAYDKPENWGALKDMVNIFLEAYLDRNKGVDKGSVAYIDGDVIVETQLEHYSNIEALNNPKKRQDFKIGHGEEAKNTTFVELQNRNQSKPSLLVRSLQYLGLSLSNLKNNEKDIGSTSQLWLLGQNERRLCGGEPIKRYALADNVHKGSFPVPVNIIYVSLPLCAKELTGAAKELAGFLLGYDMPLHDKRVIGIANTLKQELDNFREEKGLLPMLSILGERDAIIQEQGATIQELGASVQDKEATIQELRDTIAELLALSQKKDIFSKVEKNKNMINKQDGVKKTQPKKDKDL
jgi:hypothetical protein